MRALCKSTILLPALLLVASSCSDESTRPPGPCYMITPVYESGIAATDTTAARSAFESYLAHLEETGEHPAFGFSHLTYLRAGRSVSYHGSRYWHIIALGADNGGPMYEVGAFSVREDGTVVLMLGCI